VIEDIKNAVKQLSIVMFLYGLYVLIKPDTKVPKLIRKLGAVYADYYEHDREVRDLLHG